MNCAVCPAINSPSEDYTTAVMTSALVTTASDKPLFQMSGQIPRHSGRAKEPGGGSLIPVRMDSCLGDPQQEILQIFKEGNIRYKIPCLAYF